MTDLYSVLYCLGLSPKLPIAPLSRGFFMPVKRIRGRKLQAIRKRVLTANPLCEVCGRRAVEVDHIKPIFKGGDDDPLDDTNRQGLCDQCHAEKTRRDLNQRPAIGLDGYPIL